MVSLVMRPPSVSCSDSRHAKWPFPDVSWVATVGRNMPARIDSGHSPYQPAGLYGTSAGFAAMASFRALATHRWQSH
jgi:hypothetical protein